MKPLVNQGEFLIFETILERRTREASLNHQSLVKLEAPDFSCQTKAKTKLLTMWWGVTLETWALNIYCLLFPYTNKQWKLSLITLEALRNLVSKAHDSSLQERMDYEKVISWKHLSEFCSVQ